MKKLRVAINAQLMPDGPAGGIVTVLRALAALTELEGEEEYIFVGPHEHPDWMRPLLAPGQQIVRGQQTAERWKTDTLEPFKRKLGPLRPVVRGVKQFLQHAASRSATGFLNESMIELDSPLVDHDFFRNLQCDVVHFPFQSFQSCGLPSVYNPHDLQHLHHEAFFTSTEISRRENLYPMACRTAHTVVVATQFVKQDLVERYGVESKKIQIIPWAPPLASSLCAKSEAAMKGLMKKYDLKDSFALYPAMTWEHKNHLRLLEAVANIRDNQGIRLRVICTGFKTAFWPQIEKKLDELNLNGDMTFPGLVPFDELQNLYRAAQFVVVPTLFEAASAPVFEAWQSGTPVSCSNVTSLPEQVGNAALLFDPFSVSQIADALVRMATDSPLREELKRRGAQRLQDFSLERTAKAYRAVYRRAAGRELDEEDHYLLERNWTTSPREFIEEIV